MIIYEIQVTYMQAPPGGGAPGSGAPVRQVTAGTLTVDDDAAASLFGRITAALAARRIDWSGVQSLQVTRKEDF